jgi:tRNA-guanine family transglycosylase
MFEVVRKDPLSRARIGRLSTPHGVIETPSYVIVGTHGAVRCLEPEDLPHTKTQLIISNTYHLWRTLGDEGLHDFPGIHDYMQWQGPVMTDSGGFQVFSLGTLREKMMRRGGAILEEEAPGRSLVRVTESGVYFDDPDEQYLDAELSMRIQEQIGADIIVAFDEPTSPLHDHAYTKTSMERTHRWAMRSLDARRSKQLLYGVVQGGMFEDLRKESAQTIGGMPFDGFGIGGTYGDAYGGTKADTVKMLDWAIPLLPENRPRHLFGVGEIDDLLYGIEAGIDTFDCVIPTREARHGRIWTRSGPYDVKTGSVGDRHEPLMPDCLCPACAIEGTTKASLHERFKAKDLEAGRLATLHNVFFFNAFMEEARQAIYEGRFDTFKQDTLATYRRAA